MQIRLFNNQDAKYIGALVLDAVPQPEAFVTIDANTYVVTSVRFSGTTSVDLAVTLARLPPVFAGN